MTPKVTLPLDLRSVMTLEPGDPPLALPVPMHGGRIELFAVIHDSPYGEDPDPPRVNGDRL